MRKGNQRNRVWGERQHRSRSIHPSSARSKQRNTALSTSRRFNAEAPRVLRRPPGGIVNSPCVAEGAVPAPVGVIDDIGATILEIA